METVLQNPDRERMNQSTGICLRLGLPYNKLKLLLLLLGYAQDIFQSSKESQQCCF